MKHRDEKLYRLDIATLMMGHYTYEDLYVSVYVYFVTEKRAPACKLVDCTLLITEQLFHADLLNTEAN